MPAFCAFANSPHSRRCSRNSGTVKRYSSTSTKPTSCPHLSGCASFMHVALNRCKTRVWNAAGEEPPGISALQLDQDAQVWVGDGCCHLTNRGSRPLAHHSAVTHTSSCDWSSSARNNDRLLQRIPRVADLQASWLPLRY